MKTAPVAILLVIATVSVGASANAATPDRWGGAWGYAAAPVKGRAPETLPAGTYRFRVRLSQSGDGVRLTFADPAGALPLRIARVAIAPASGAGFALDPAHEHVLRFANGAGATIAAGKAATTVPADFAARSGADVIVSVTTAAPTTVVAANAGFVAGFGRGAIDDAGAGLEPRRMRPFLSLVAVRNPSAACTIVAFGDSITEGVGGKRGAWRGWPGRLAQRLIAAEPDHHCGVVNAGIGGNRLLRAGRGASGLARFDRDVASVPGVTDMILLEGINDIGRSKGPGQPKLAVADLIAGYKAMIAKAHARGIRVIGATLTPSYGSRYVTGALERIRQDVNAWIRTGGAFDAVVDFEAALGDGGTPPRMKPAFDSGGHLHPDDAGYDAMGDAVPLSLFPPH